MAPIAGLDHASSGVNPAERRHMTAEQLKRKIRNFPAAALQERIAR